MRGQSGGHESGPGAHVGLHEEVEVKLLVEVFRKARTQEDSTCKGPGVNETSTFRAVPDHHQARVHELGTRRDQELCLFCAWP